MKLFGAVVIASWLLIDRTAAFSAVAPQSSVPKSTDSKKAQNFEPVDKTLDGIDAAGSFDPTDGDNAAVERNNKDEVWVPQVRVLYVTKR
jgi:hypothetical protein